MVAYAATTRDITVTVRPIYLDEPSDVFERQFFFGYLVRIVNDGDTEVQLLRRHWRVLERSGRVQDVEGEGVVGRQPVIGPGDVHVYDSFCALHDMEGVMEGTYLVQDVRGERFRITIPRFHLRAAAN